MPFEICTDIHEAESIWQLLSPKKTIYDLWEFRFCFYKYYQYPLHFIVGYDGPTVIGLLPLQFNTEKNYYEFFGTYYMETNQVFVKPGYESAIPDFYHAVPHPHQLECISVQESFVNSLPVQDQKYILPLQDYENFEAYLNSAFSGKSRSALKKKIRDIDALGTLEFVENRYEDIELMFELNIKTFNEKFAEKGGRTSSFLYPHRQDIFRDFLKLPLDPYLLTLFINGKKQAASITLRYNGWYVFLNTGADIAEVPNLGTYMYYHNIKKAFEQKAEFFDAGVESYGWKERFHLVPTPQHIFSDVESTH